MNEREELVKILATKRVYVNTSLGMHEATADAILAAGYRKPRVVTTAEELYELPIGSAIVDSTDLVYVRDSGGRLPCKVAQAGEFAFVSLPATVLYEGGW